MITVEKIQHKDLEKAFDVRRKVFVEEQNVDVNEEYDQFEEESVHYLAYIESEVVGTARWRQVGDKVKLERFAVLPQYRGRHIGAALVEAVLADVLPLQKTIYLHAQLHVIPFYEKMGFYAKGEVFEEAGITHRVMEFPSVIV